MKLKRNHKKVKVVKTVHLLIDNMTGGKQENDSGIKVMTPRIIVSSSVPRGCGLDCQVRKKTYGNWGKPTFKFIIIIIITFIFYTR